MTQASPSSARAHCANGHALADGEQFCGDCGAKAAAPDMLRALAQYEALFAEFAADGVLEAWEEDELRAARAELGLAEVAHDAIAARFSLKREVHPVAVELDAATVAELVAGAPGAVRARIVNGGQRAIRNVEVRTAILGQAGVARHAMRVVPPGRDEVFAVDLGLLRAGQFVLHASVRIEDVLGKASYFVGDPVPYTVARPAASGPQTVVANIDVSSMRVGDLSGLQVGVAAASAGRVIQSARWTPIALRSVGEEPWREWEDEHDGGRRRAAEEEERSEPVNVSPDPTN